MSMVGKKVLCVDNKDGGDYLTIGKEYTVINEEGRFYRVENDKEYGSLYFKDQFKPVEQPAPRKFAVGDKVKIVKKFESSDLLSWARSMDDTVGTSGVISGEYTNSGRIEAFMVNGWSYLPESLELVAEEAPVEEPVQPTAIDSHYNFNYSLTQWDHDMGVIKLDPYFVAKQWDLGSKDPSGVIFHILKTCARFGEKNDKGREIKAIYKSIKRLAELEGVTLEEQQ